MGILKFIYAGEIVYLPCGKSPLKKPEGVRMLGQHIRDVKAELDKAGKSLALICWHG